MKEHTDYLELLMKIPAELLAFVSCVFSLLPNSGIKRLVLGGAGVKTIPAGR